MEAAVLVFAGVLVVIAVGGADLQVAHLEDIDEAAVDEEDNR